MIVNLPMVVRASDVWDHEPVRTNPSFQVLGFLDLNRTCNFFEVHYIKCRNDMSQQPSWISSLRAQVSKMSYLDETSSDLSWQVASSGEYTTSERVISGDKGVGVLLYSVMASSSAVIALLKLREHTCVRYGHANFSTYASANCLMSNSSCCLCQHEVGIPHTTTSSTPTSGVLTTRIGLPPSIADQSHSSQRPLMPWQSLYNQYRLIGRTGFLSILCRLWYHTLLYNIMIMIELIRN